ncbi:hypothetical protein EDWATA_02322 [Edwardsiella tarda ATCC 23685]|uniref:Uncharacterized protein n=1 Tax=Edwardsiella tarda ATCC 23685 TaxID=500638 RepID=D4F6E1_EDWTA|nr:hypothetical protein EDWATA_02322 [Edwardsiella tarda ATCC 23685]
MAATMPGEAGRESSFVRWPCRGRPGWRGEVSPYFRSCVRITEFTVTDC